MKIAFDGQTLLEKEKTGIGYYTEGLVEHIIEQNAEDQFYINVFSFKQNRIKEKILEKYQKKNTKIQICKWFPLRLYKMIWNIIPIPYWLFFKKKMDLTHFFNFYIPPFVKGKRVCTIHDMTIKAYPKTVRIENRIMMMLNLKKTCKRADRIITSSEFSKKEIVKYMDVNPDKISVLYSGVNLDLYKPCKNLEKIKKVRDKYSIPDKYYLYLGTLEPRKNIERLIMGYGILKSKKEKKIPKLVIAGKKGWMYEDIFKLVKEKELLDDIIFTGYVTQAEAPILMSGAVAFVFPSLYEGFGMPPLEAMACGTPVITSNCASLPEVVGNDGILVDPYSVEEISNALEEIYIDSEKAKKMSIMGIERAKKFSWDILSKKLYEIYEQTIKE